MAFDANDLTPHEHFVVERTRLGEIADLAPMTGPGGAKPVLRAGFLRKLLLQLDPNWAVQAPGVRVRGARIEGGLDLSDCSGSGAGAGGLPALALTGCDFADAIDLSHARLARLSLRGSRFGVLRASALVLDGPFDLRESGAKGADDEAWIAASGARIAGDIIADDAKLRAPPPRAEIQKGRRQYAFHLRSAEIAGSVFMGMGFEAHGGVNLDGAGVGGAIIARGARLTAGEHDAFRACGARVGGDLNFTEGFAASGPISLEAAHVSGELKLESARLDGLGAAALDCTNAELGGVSGAFKAEGALRLQGARIRANLDLRGVEIGHRAAQRGEAPGRALDAASATIGGAALLNGANMKGEVFLADVRIEGYLAFGGGRFINPGGWAIRAPNARVGGNLTLKIDDGGFAPHGQKTVIEGAAKFDRARVSGAFSWLNLELRGPGPEGKGALFSIADAHIDGPLQARALTAQRDAHIDATGATCISLEDDVKTGWGAPDGPLALEGFIYERLETEDERWSKRVAWLKRTRLGGARFSPQPFAHAARVYARMGLREGARRLSLAQRDLHTLSQVGASPISWPLSSLFGLVAGYGLAPLRIVRAMALFLAFGVAGVLAMNEQGALITPTGAPCNGAVEPALYAVDVALPVIELGQETRCAPGRTPSADLSPGLAIGESDWRLFEGASLWKWAHALYAVLGAILTALAVLTFSGALKPRDD